VRVGADVARRLNGRQPTPGASPSPEAAKPPPDGLSVDPPGKQILGLDDYWQEFRSAVLSSPSDLWKALMAKPGSTPVDMEV
jgi:hypothetical protein